MSIVNSIIKSIIKCTKKKLIDVIQKLNEYKVKVIKLIYYNLN